MLIEDIQFIEIGRDRRNISLQRNSQFLQTMSENDEFSQV